MGEPLSEATVPKRWRRVLACILLCAACSQAPAQETAQETAPAPDPAPDTTVDLGALTFTMQEARQATHVVARITARFADAPRAAPHRDPDGIIRLRDAALEAVRDARSGAGGEPIDVAAMERRLRREFTGRAPGLEGVQFEVLGVRSVERP